LTYFQELALLHPRANECWGREGEEEEEEEEEEEGAQAI
jgi:hypothetical protein